MLIFLPAFFAIGFCIGFFLSRGQLPGFRPPGQWREVQTIDLLNLVIWGVVAVVLLGTVIGPLLSFVDVPALHVPSGRFLLFASVVVGALAGRWFIDPDGSRDKIIFVAGAAGFLFLAALDYDHNVFANLSKIGGSEFSVEFSAQSRSAGTGNPVASAAQSNSQAVFPGASEVDLSIGSLVALLKFIVNDEQYAELFSQSYSKIPKHDTDNGKIEFVDRMSGPTKAFLAYSCNTIVPFSEELDALQDFYRSDTSVLALDPRLIPALRREYVRARWKSEDGSPDKYLVGTDVNQNDFDNADLPMIFGTENDQIRREFASFSLDNGSVHHAEEKKLEPYSCSGIRQQLKLGDATMFPMASATDPNPRGFFAYMALTVALAEFGVGARESAIHLLEREIQAERIDLKASSSNYTLSYAEGLVILSRLQLIQYEMIEAISAQEADFMRIDKLRQRVEDYDAVLEIFDPETEPNKMALRKSLHRRTSEDPFPLPVQRNYETWKTPARANCSHSLLSLRLPPKTRFWTILVRIRV
jgi:hypothetical protein